MADSSDPPTQPGSLAQRERLALADLFDAVGPDAGTLCTGWSTRDLVAHLVLREGHPAAFGIVIPPLSGWTRAQQQRISAAPYASIVERFRRGAPKISPLRLPGADVAANTFEHFVHHEDVLRAQTSWKPRNLAASDQRTLWHQLAKRSRVYVRGAPVPVRFEGDGVGAVSVGNTDLPSAVTLSGTPAELVMYVHGRREQARVEVEGSDTSLGLWQQHSLAV